MDKRITPVSVMCVFLALGSVLAQEGKPNFSGTWKFSKEKSDLRSPTFRQPAGGDMGGPGMGGPGMGGPGMGGPGAGGPGMGGPGMGGPGMGGPGMGGPPMGRQGGGGRGRPGGGPAGGDPNMMGVAESITIQHDEPKLVLKIPFKVGEEEQTVQSEHTTDGKKNQNTVPGLGTITSKTSWKKNRLITKSSFDSPFGPVQSTDDRTLSEDGKTMTIQSTVTSGLMDWKRTLVYEKADAGGDQK